MKDIRKETLMEVWQKWSNMDDLAFDQWLHTEMHKEQAGINCPVMRPASASGEGRTVASEGEEKGVSGGDCPSCKIYRKAPYYAACQICGNEF